MRRKHRRSLFSPPRRPPAALQPAVSNLLWRELIETLATRRRLDRLDYALIFVRHRVQMPPL